MAAQRPVNYGEVAIKNTKLLPLAARNTENKRTCGPWYEELMQI